MKMALIDSVLAACRRLAPLGWATLLARHGLHLDRRTLRSSRRLADELIRELTIDRSVSGFEDFWPDGNAAISRGRPSRSLLYHALASPLVHPDSTGITKASSYPTLEELDVIENYIYSLNKKPLAEFLKEKDLDGTLVVGVFAYQYRVGGRSANGKFASTALSRTGVARVGTTAHFYDPVRRSFWPINPNDKEKKQVAVMPARYAAYLAEVRPPGAEDAILGEQPGDEDRNFLFPIHKLFDGTECLTNCDLTLKFAERHRNEKLAKFHADPDGARVKVLDGFDITQAPFVRDSGNRSKLVQLKRVGDSVLVVPKHHPTLNRVALARNYKTDRQEIARFIVPKQFGDNRYAGSSYQFLEEKFAERRTAPEYINIRHEVKDPRNPRKIEDLNRLPWARFKVKVKKGGYEAAHFLDDSCEGCVVVRVSGLQMEDPNKTNFAAFSMVCAPDFFPLVDQADITDWVHQVLGPGGEREQFAQGGPRPLSERRNCVNPKLLQPSAPVVPAFPVRDDGYARIETVSAIVGGKSRGKNEEERPLKDLRFHDPSTSFLPDGASGIFDPGWDTSFSGDDQADFLAAYGLGSPFPEDIKLCAALNSFWPSAAPDATRTFALFPPKWKATTSVPLMDVELGLHPNHPDVRGGVYRASLGWDGEQGPYYERNYRFINHANIEHSDYVSNALARRISISGLADIRALDMFRRMNAVRDSIAVLPEDPARVSATKLLLVSAQIVERWEQRKDRGDDRLDGPGYLFSFATVGKVGRPSTIPRRWVRRVKRRYTCQIGVRAICWKKEAKGELFHFEPRPQGILGS
jgi:hypothetical protein